MKAEKQYRSPTCLPNNTKSTSPTLQFIDNRQETAIQAQLIQVIQQAGITYPCIQCKIGEGKAIGQVVKKTETGDTYTIVAVQEGQYKLDAHSTSSSAPSSVYVDFDDEGYVCQPPIVANDSEDTKPPISLPSSETGSDDEIPFFLRDLDDSFGKEDDTQGWDFGPMEKADYQSPEDEEDKEDDQTEEKESSITELRGGKQGIPDYIHQQLGFPPTLRIPSLAYLYGRSQINEDFRDLSDFFVEEIKQILSAEIGQIDHHVVVYHSTSIFSYLFTEITGYLYKTLNKSIASSFVFFRDFANPDFQGQESPTSFLKEKIFTRKEETTSEKKLWTDHLDRDLLLSVNLSLLGHYSNSGEQSYHFNSAGGVGMLSSSLPDMISKLSLAEPWKQALLPPITASIKKLCQQIKKIRQNRQGQTLPTDHWEETRDSVLYQIFIPKEILDRCIYIAQVNGTPLSKPITTPCDLSPQSIFQGMVAAGKANELYDLERYGNTHLQQLPSTDPCSFFTSGEFTHMVFEAARYKEFWQAFSRQWAEPQARILFNEATNPFTNPEIASPQGLKTNTYTFLSKEISGIVIPVLAEIKNLIEQTIQQTPPPI